MLPSVSPASLDSKSIPASAWAVIDQSYDISATLALSISVIIHPSLLTRIALTAVFAPLGMVLCLLPFPRIARVSYRVASASTGAFGVVLTIALMGHVSAWSNVWERYWVQDGGDWGTSKEKGLSAAYCLLLASGLVCDWFLHLKFGENPDEVSLMSLVFYIYTYRRIRNGTITSRSTPLIFQTIAVGRGLSHRLCHSGIACLDHTEVSLPLYQTLLFRMMRT